MAHPPEAPGAGAGGDAAPAVRLAVCVATYLRPDGLQRMLRGLAAATFADPVPRVEVVVVDNDAGGSAREVCELARDWLPHSLHYVIEKRRGIPQARNAALAVAMPLADFVVITDDDVEPTPGWLAELLRVQAHYHADVVTGPNPPRFLDEPPAWVVEGRFFEGPLRETGTPVENAATHNVLVRCAVLAQMDRLFDERLGLQGCEDSEFFRRVGRDHRMVWADDALVHECVPASRTTARWLTQRAYRIANGRAHPALRRLEGLTGCDALIAGLRSLAYGAIDLAAGLGRGPVERVHGLRQLAAGLGWISGLLGVRYREYRWVHGR